MLNKSINLLTLKITTNHYMIMIIHIHNSTSYYHYLKLIIQSVHLLFPPIVFFHPSQ